MREIKFTPEEKRYFMQETMRTAKLSTCSRRNVGAIVVGWKEHRILGYGHNGAPGLLQPCLRNGCARTGLASGDRLDLCRALHAEERALLQALSCTTLTRARLSAIVFVSHAPCRHCASLMVEAGILKVIYNSAYGDMSGLDILKENGVQVEHYIDKEIDNGNEGKEGHR